MPYFVYNAMQAHTALDNANIGGGGLTFSCVYI